MTAFDPLAAIQADAALAQSAIAAIDLGVQIEILQSQLSIGDLITATILPPQGGSDLLSFLGQTVLAQLPPGINPGESLLLQVTGFQGNNILVRNIGVVDPNNPPPTVTVTLPPAEPGTPAQATLTTIVQPDEPAAPDNASPKSVTQSAAQPPAVQTPVPQTPSLPSQVAPSRAVFVAASVKPAAPAPDAPFPRTVTPIPIELGDAEELHVEARIIATRAAAIDIADVVNQPPQKPAAQSQPAPAVAAQAAAPAARPPQAPVVPPRITPAGSAPAAPERAQAIAPELALLARLRIPPLPFTLGAARLASNAAAILPRALARLDAALAAVADGDARASTLRTIAAFISRLDPSNARGTLPEQLMAYVSNVVDSAEGKLAAIVRALSAEAQEPLPEAQAAPAPAAPPEAAATTNAPPTSAPSDVQGEMQQQQVNPPVALAPQAAERAVALQYDLKAAIVSMIDAPARSAPPALTAALGETLAAVTGVQLNVLNAQNADPNAIVIPLPVFYHDGGRPAQLRISRDAPNGRDKLDADNFHIAFVLDTKSLGTVAVDVQTASRSVSINVKTEGPTAAERFKETFGDLRGRLEQLRYRVASIAASVAPRARPAAESSEAASEAEGLSKSRFDAQA